MVVLPTGSGKTALMTILAYGIARERVLVIRTLPSDTRTDRPRV